MSRSNWVVSISTADNDPLIFGPYTERMAKSVRDRFEARVDKDDFEFILATAYPIQPDGVAAILKEFGQ